MFLLEGSWLLFNSSISVVYEYIYQVDIHEMLDCSVFLNSSAPEP